MVNEISLDMQQIIVTIGKVDFPDFERLKMEALELAESLNSHEVSDENIQKSKKLIAAVAKRVKELETRRITVKNAILEPYQVFEQQVKTIVGIVKDAEDIVRNQVKQLEEQERSQKESVLKELFDKRIIHYSFRDLFSFDDFLKPKHLNKTTSIDSVEKDMVEFLERIGKDIKAIEAMPNAEAVMGFYMDVKDLSAAITLAQQQEQRRKRIEESEALKEAVENIGVWEFYIYNEKDAKLAAMLLDQHKIKYELEIG